MAEGVTVEQAETDLAVVMERLARDFPQTNAGIAPLVRPFRDPTTSGPIRIVFAGLMGAAIFLLLIACANVANLLLARGATRAREITLRVSLGATRRQVVRQLLAESLLLALIAGAIGLALAAAGVRLLQLSITGTGEPYWLRFPIEGGVFAFVAAVCLGTTVLCGLAPALHATTARSRRRVERGGPHYGRRRRCTALDGRLRRSPARAQPDDADGGWSDDAERRGVVATGRRRGHTGSGVGAGEPAGAEVSNGRGAPRLLSTAR